MNAKVIFPFTFLAKQKYLVFYQVENQYENHEGNQVENMVLYSFYQVINQVEKLVRLIFLPGRKPGRNTGFLPG